MIIKDNNPYKEASFSLGNRIARAVWGGVWIFFFRPSPRPMHAWRCLLLKIFGAKLGNNFRIQPSVKIWLPANLMAGDFVGIGEGVHLYNMNKIILGDFTSISMGATLCAGSHDYDSTNHQLISAPIIIGKHCWICAESFIHPGLTIPDGVVLGARSVLIRSPEKEWFVYSGFPARAIKERVKKAINV